MAISFNEVLQKVLDNANLGKAVTDLGPGFALSIPMLMVLSLVSEISILPADRLKEIRDQRRATEKQVREHKEGFCPILNAQGQPCQRPLAQQGEEGWIKGRQRIAILSAEAEAYREKVRLLAKQARPLDAGQEKIGQETLRQLEPLLAQKEFVDEASARLESLSNQETDARSLENNLASFTNNISMVIAFSIVLGVLVSQASHLLFIDFLYGRFPPVKQILSSCAVTTEQLMSKQDDELVKNYYRYTEGAVNSILPVLLTGYVFPHYASQKLELTVSSMRLLTWTWVIVAVLATVGYRTYKSFLNKRAQLAREAADGKVQFISRLT